MLSLFKRHKHLQYLENLPRLSQDAAGITVLHGARQFHQTLLECIAKAERRICLSALYLENDDGGRSVLAALYAAKAARPQLEVSVLVDWHRAQRGRIGDAKSATNADWYCQEAMAHPALDIAVYGVPVNTREALGVLHLKGFIIDDTLLYSGASLNDVYLQQHHKYRYDRYHLLQNPALADAFYHWIASHLIGGQAVNRLNLADRPSSQQLKNAMRRFRKELQGRGYEYSDNSRSGELAVIPLVGLGKGNALNSTICHLLSATEQSLTLCTPYFNLPGELVKRIIRLLRQGKTVEIIVGDKTANDFFIPPDQPFRVIGALPYLYEINLRRFLARLQTFVDNGQLVVRLWQDGDNSYHLKGIWVDERWTMITGNNLNPRAWRLDLENAVLIDDPKAELRERRQQELACIRHHCQQVVHFTDLQAIGDYPAKVKKLIRRLRRVRIDRLINRIL
ncbi:MAG: CDP-diacylglycerol--serine O-phosphatidyltransferase [Pseudomonadota bacterium]|uniref:CDP-diacylglycerol--serine O-phosphatidyltransferase n=1 Tax=Gallaecimonas pentaromativorans TaxID=584787 RepID=UPI00067EFDF9|nr:CDP-diacylglycerol--serine O-phosphatidyltransferase [Gallaecimonas pentaromativorans]MED5526573.1 CDP-diacylglycerol--serine O-phosphatidyltransferase [Pseudomonadota bacterium]